MAHNKTLTKNRVFGISDDMDDLLKLYSSRKGVSLSELIRICVSEKIEKLKLEEQKFWKKLSAEKLNEILSTLENYLSPKIAGLGKVICKHSNIWENNYDENFTHTKEFCKEHRIEHKAFLKRIEADFEITFDCECEFYETLKNRSNDNEK